MSDAISQLVSMVRLMVGRGKVVGVDDAGQVQRLQVDAGGDETIDKVPRLGQYGFVSVPPVGSDVVVVFIAGERANGAAIASGNQSFRMRGLADGEVALHDNKGQKIYISAAGIRIDGGGLPIEVSNTPLFKVTADTIELDGPTTINGTLVVNGDTTLNGATNLGGSVTQTEAAPIVFLDVVGAPDFSTPTFSLLEHRHGGVRGGTDDSGGAIPL
jgi:phage baseplate assembly protein V